MFGSLFGVVHACEAQVVKAMLERLASVPLKWVDGSRGLGPLLSGEDPTLSGLSNSTIREASLAWRSCAKCAGQSAHPKFVLGLSFHRTAYRMVTEVILPRSA